jgi:tetratricopeptide (TPR) repeat protein
VVRRVAIAAGVMLSWCWAAGLPAAEPEAPAGAAASATTQTSESIAALIAGLGDPDPEAREHASKAVWALGRQAEPALQAAAKGRNPEIARRARAILRDFDYGLYPDAPHEVFVLLEEYRKGTPQEKRAAVMQLAGQGVPGLRVLLKLREDERDPNWKLMISQSLSPREHEVSVLMLANGQAAEVERMLERSAVDSPVAAQDYAALLYFKGTLKQTLATLKSQPITPENAVMRVALARAAGDAPAAREAAEKSGNDDLLDAVLVEQGDWKTLADRVTAEPRQLLPAERFAFQCAYARLSGDKKTADAAAEHLADRARMAPQDYPPVMEDLFLNDYPDAAMKVILQQHDYLLASEFLATRLQFKEALDLPRLAAQNQPAEALQVKARTVGTLYFLGETDEAQKMMDEVIAENSLRHDFGTWASLVEAAREAGLKDRADDIAARALATATQQEPVALVFDKLRLGSDNGATATRWWQFLARDAKEKPAAERLHRLRAIMGTTLPSSEWDSISNSARRFGAEMAVVERAAWQQTVIDALVAAGRLDLANQWIARLEDSGASGSLVYAGDYHAQQKDWPAAAHDYSQAWEHDRTRADALFLWGWALVQSGDAKQGAELMARGRELPLGNETGRFELAQAMARHNLKDEATKQYELILTLTEPRSWERNEALRRTAEDLAMAGDDLAAADRWDKAFLQNLTNLLSFNEPWANVVVPALIHKTRALGLIKANRVEAALNETRIALDETPADADALIDIVNALDCTGHHKEANALYATQTAVYRKLIETYPKSGPLHNQLAWSQVMCHRELDDALKNGRRAVELEPFSTASRDTLAEVYFARGDAAAAAAQMQKCVELEPTVPRHRHQLARFRAAETQPTTRP